MKKLKNSIRKYPVYFWVGLSIASFVMFGFEFWLLKTLMVIEPSPEDALFLGFAKGILSVFTGIGMALFFFCLAMIFIVKKKH